MYLSNADSVHAYAMYIKASNVTSNYLNKYKAYLGQATSLSRLGRGNDATNLLTELRRNTNYKEYWGEIDVETGDAYKRMKKYSEAVDQYDYVDTAYARSEWGTLADLHLGLLWEKVFGDFDSARAAYMRARPTGTPSVAWPIVLI